MPNLAFHFAEHHTRVDVALDMRTAGGLNICLLQLPPTVNQALVDAPRPTAVAVLQELLVDRGADQPAILQDLMPGGGPVLIVAPEYAFGSGDWADVDQAVRASNRPVVLVTGFGATLGQAVLDWQAALMPGGTVRHLGWEQANHQISGLMRVNGGWCWIHEPGAGGSTHCITYIKNVLQQAFEAVALADLQTGHTFLHLRFNDLDVLPLICADLLQPAAQNAASPQARMRQMFQALPNDRPALIVGSLLQIAFNQNWAIAIDSLLNTVLAGRDGAVALSNVAHDKPEADEGRDKWRSLTGVFVPYSDFARGQAGLPAVRPLSAQNVVGAVVRQTHPSVTAGVLNWRPYNPVAGSFIWRGNMVCAVGPHGLTTPVTLPTSATACEISRFLRRHPVDAAVAPRLTAGITEIGEQLKRGTPPDPASLLRETLDGTKTGKVVNPDELHEPELISALKSGLHALATLKSIDGIEWQATRGITGQLRRAGQDRSIMVWRSSSDTRRGMQRELANWKNQGGAHPYLVVFGSTRMGDLADEELKDERRDDISSAPKQDTQLLAGGSLATVVGDITATKGMRRVACLALSHVADVYADYDAEDDEARVTALLGQIDAAFQGDGA